MSQATQAGSDLATEGRSVTDQTKGLLSSATSAAEHLLQQLLPQAVSVGTTKTYLDFSSQKCYGFTLIQPLL